MESKIPRQRDLALAVCLSLGLAACGGGGGSRSGGGGVVVAPPVKPPVTPPPTQPTQPDPPIDAQLALTGANVAQAAGFTGKGIAIGIVDSGVTATHPALAGRVTANLTYVDPSTNNMGVDDVVGHGTAVAQIAAGRPFGQFAGGVAPDATLISARIINDKAPTDDGSGQGNQATSSDPLGKVNSDVVAAGAKVLNNSWGGVYWSASDTAATQSFQSAYQPFTANHLFVFAAGNDSRADPSDVAALPSRAAGVEQGWLVVVALDSNNPTQIASYSNRCGIAMNYCLAAPGAVITTSATSTVANTSYQVWTGTSLAAPQVSGAAAVVMQAFPTLSVNSVRQIILGTADDLGAPGPDAIYGYGALDVGRAIRGPATFDWGDFQATTSAGRDMAFVNDIKGASGLVVSGNGRLTLSGTNTYAGGTTVNDSATLESLRALPGSAFTNGTATLIAHGDIGGGVLNNAQLVTLDTSTHVGGDFRQGTNGRLSQKLGAPLIVGGTAYLAGDFYVAGAVPGYTVSSHQQVVTANAVSGTFATLTKGAGVFLSSTLQYLPKEVWLDTTSLSVTQVATTSMSQSVAAVSSAQRLDGAFAQITASLASGSPTAAAVDARTLIAAGSIQQSSTQQVAQASLESLSGQLYAASTAVTLAGIEAGNDALIDHLDARGPTGAWAQSLGSQGGLSRSGFGNVGFNIGGQLVGNDIRLGNNGFAGVAVSQMRSTGQLSGSMDRQSNRATEGMLYAGLRGANWYGVGRFGFGSFRGDTQRLLQLGDQGAFAGADNTGHYNVAYGEFGYRTNVGAFTLTPYANAQFASIRRNGFEEAGGEGFGLAANGQTTSRWQAGFGLRAGSSWLTSYGKLRIDAKLGWQNAFATKGEVFSARYNGIAQWAPVEGIGLSRRAGTAGFTMGWDLSERSTFAMDVEQRFADRDHSHSASLSYRLAW
ncbi:MAG TPA: S8 family serine peptidase [Luteibacter sp.]|uniref:S8 family serine peptidase n=1 Tax=Luteibacter sp. TaxID=1886636 RepID=UPI002BDC9398|nr:S8 family serine peptidase [Luteibacter sp.]HVI54700.1 S8 family serine peptidase [Luteibacter sp.]